MIKGIFKLKRKDHRNTKITKGKNIGKGIHAVKVVEQPLRKLVGRLKDKCSKIIYIYKKQLKDIQKYVKYDVRTLNMDRGLTTFNIYIVIFKLHCN